MDSECLVNVVRPSSEPEDFTNLFLVESTAMSMPTEIMQHIYSFLSPADFNAARYTCRSWFSAGYDRLLLIEMLKRGGWWSSMLRILTPMRIAPVPNSNHERIMSKWISRECALANINKSCFTEVGYTDFSELVPGSRQGALHGAMSFTVSLCGRFLLATHGEIVYVYELNHECPQDRSRWSVPLRRREGLPLGSLRPVTTIVCPKTVISCSMDTSEGRNSVAFLMEGRMGLVCEILPERLGACIATSSHTSWTESGASGSSSATATSASFSTCVCRRSPINRALPVEEGSRSVYRCVCHPDDPPRSVALCPQRSCVAFGCSSGIELH